MMLWLLMGGLTWAVETPDLNAQTYRPPTDSEFTQWADESGAITRDPLITSRIVTHYGHDLLQYTKGDQRTSIIRNVLQADAIAAFHIDRFRIAADLPLYLVTAGEEAQTEAGLGDVALDARLTILDSRDSPIGLALAGRAALPTTTVEIPIGAGNLVGSTQLIIDARVKRYGLVALNLGTRFQPNVALPNITLDDAFFVRLGGGVHLSETISVSIDLNANLNLQQASRSGTTVEWLAGPIVRLTDELALRTAIGTGLTRGIGSPDVRILAGLSFNPKRTVPIAADPCADDPSACADITYPVTLTAIDESGTLVPEAELRVQAPGLGLKSTGEWTLDLTSGQYEAVAVADGYDTTKIPFTVRREGLSLQPVLYPAVAQTQLTLFVRTSNGRAPERVQWSIDDTPAEILNEDTLQLSLPAGEHTYTISADGYSTVTETARLVEGKGLEKTILLEPSKVHVTTEAITVDGKVYFETADAEIRPDSYALLNEIASVLKQNPQLRRIRIEGHTDSRGSAAFNRALSEQRAAAVRDFLISLGIDGSRLTSIGYGEERPLDPSQTSAAWEKNRRVDFVIVNRD